MRLSVVMAPLISWRRFFDVLTLTDEFTANIVLFHLGSASRAFLRTFTADTRLDNRFNPIFGVCTIIINIYRINSEIKYIRNNYNSCAECVALYFSSLINYVDKIFLRDRIIVVRFISDRSISKLLIFKTRLIDLIQTRYFSSFGV